MMKNKDTAGRFKGSWHIHEIETWDEDYFNTEVQAYIEIKPDGHGEFQFGLVSSQIDGEVIINGTKEPEKSRRKNHENQEFVLWLSRHTRMVNQHDSGSSDSNQCDLHFCTGLAPVARSKSGWEGNGIRIAREMARRTDSKVENNCGYR